MAQCTYIAALTKDKFGCKTMAELRDEYGNPIQLTDEHGNPVQLTDERGNPVIIKGMAVKEPAATAETEEEIKLSDTGVLASSGPTEGNEGKHETVDQHGGENKKEEPETGSGEIQRSTSSSSGSSEDDGQGGRRKKKGMVQKLKEKLHVGKHKEKHEQRESATSASSTTILTKEQEEHEKKSVIGKIKEKLPCHHNR